MERRPCVIVVGCSCGGVAWNVERGTWYRSDVGRLCLRGWFVEFAVGGGV
jgi:hypothetical protein